MAKVRMWIRAGMCLAVIGPLPVMAQQPTFAATESSANQMLLHGTELGYAWSIALDTISGKLAATLVEREGVIVLFGACTVQ